MNESAIRDAIWDWVNKATDYTGPQLFWEGQRTPAEDETYITLKLGDILNDGMDFLTFSELAEPTLEADARATFEGPRDVVLTVQCHNAGIVGQSNSQILNKVVSFINSPSVQAFFAGKLGVGTVSPIRTIEGAPGLYDPRAIVDINLHVVSSFYEDIPTIQHVEITNEISDTTQVVSPQPES